MIKIILFVFAFMIVLSIAFAILKLVWRVFLFLLKGTLVLGIVGLAIMFYQISIPLLILFFVVRAISRFRYRRRIKKWVKKKPIQLAEHQLDQLLLPVMANLPESDLNENDYKFNEKSIPYGRANAFLNYFNKSIDTDEVLYYSPIKSMDDNELREYGLAITRTGILLSTQYKVENNNEKYCSKEVNISFSGLWATKIMNDELVLEYVDPQQCKVSQVKIQQYQSTVPLYNLKSICDTVIDNGVSHLLSTDRILSDFEYEMMQDEIDKADEKFNKNQKVINAESLSSVAGVMGAKDPINSQFDELKYHMNGSRGSGYGAEYANNTIDKVLGRKVENLAQDLENGRQKKHGADRSVNGIDIQTKYYKTASESIGAAFEKKQALYKNEDGTMMQIEVPRDQYQQALELMQKRIDSGQVPGVQPGDDPRKYVRKGFFTYSQAHNVCKAGTIESLSIDALNGAVCCSFAGGISALMVFSIACWNGQDPKEAAKAGMRTGLEVMGKGTLIYTISMQLSRDQFANPFVKEFTKDGILKGYAGINNPIFAASENLANTISNSAITQNQVGQFMGLDKLSGRGVIAGGVTAMVIFGPDMCRALSGRISTKQLFKNTAVGVSGIGGSVVGQALIPIPVVGAMVGGMVGGFVAKATLDAFIEDDAKLMFQILKEQFLDVVMLAGLNEDEFEEVVNMTLCSSKLPSLLRDMYASQDYRNFAREALVSAAVVKVLSNRQFISEDFVSEEYVTLVEQSA